MARPRGVEDEELLAIARAIFMERGVDAPASAVARAAGVSEATLFKRFQSKDRMLALAMRLPDVEALRAEILAPMAVGEERAHIERCALQMIGFFRVMLPRMLALYAAGPSGFEAGCLPGCDGEPPPRRVLLALTSQLELCAARGVLGDAQPELVARVLIGSVHNFVFFEHLGITSEAAPDAASYVRGLVDLVWYGAVARREAA